ncbi:MAG: ABC transporter permease, partial [Longicatena sp.]
GVGILKLVNQLHLADIPQKTFKAVLYEIDFQAEWILQLIFVFLFLFAGILLIQLLMVIVSSFISNIEEAGNVQAPFYMVMLGVYYLTISLNSPYHMNEGIGYYCSFIPFLSMLFMPCRILQGTATLYELFLAFSFAAGTFLLLIKHGSKVYQKGVLDYSSKGFIHILKQIKNT